MWEDLKFNAVRARSTLAISFEKLFTCIYFLEIIIEIIYILYILAPSYNPSLIVILIKDNVSHKL